MTYSHRIWLYAPVAALLILIAAISFYWWGAADAFSARIDAANHHLIAPGVTLDFQHKEIGGYPFRLDAVFTGLTLALATSHGPVTWRSEHFALHQLDYGDLHAVLEAAGPQRWDWRDAAGQSHHVAFTPALFRGSVVGGHSGAGRIDIELFAARDARYGLEHGEIHLRRDPKADALDMVLMADGLRLGPDAVNLPAQTITRFRATALLAPAAGVSEVFAGRSQWRQAASAFQARHGVIDLTMLDLDWGKVEAKGEGTFTLDAFGRPQGALHLSLTGQPPAQSAKPGLLGALMGAATGEARPVSLVFKDGLAYLNGTPAGFAEPLY